MNERVLVWEGCTNVRDLGALDHAIPFRGQAIMGQAFGKAPRINRKPLDRALQPLNKGKCALKRRR